MNIDDIIESKRNKLKNNLERLKLLQQNILKLKQHCQNIYNKS